MTLVVVLIFTLGSVCAQSVNDEGLSEKNKVLKSSSSTDTAQSTTAKVATNTKVTNVKNTKTTTNTKKTTTATTTKKTSATSTAKKTNTTKATTTNKNTAKSNTTTVNKKTLAKTSTSFMNYVEKNGKFPKVKISNKNYSNTEYLYLISKSVENNSKSKIEIKNNLVKAYNNTKSRSVKGTLNKTEYVQLAGKTRKFIEKNQRAPNWVSSSKGKIPYNQLILTFSKCLDNYNKTNKLPNSIKLDDLDLDTIKNKIDNNSKSTTSSAKTQAANKTTATKNTTKTTTNKTATTKTTNKTTAVNNSNSTDKIDTSPVEDCNKTLAKKSIDYVHSILNNILDRLDPSKYKIDVSKSDEANVKFNTSKVNVDVSGKSTINVEISAKNTTATNKKATKTATKTTTKTTTTKKNSTSTAKKTTTKTTTTKKNSTSTAKKTTAKSTSNTKKASTKTVSKKSTVKTVQKIAAALKQYLSSSKNCQVANKEIKSLANKLTSTLKTDYEKGKKLFEWVRDNIGYDKYRNTRRGALKTLKNRMGNCVDQSHLLVALSRAAGIPARYVNANNCRFTSGYVSGHVWTEMYIKNKWVVADTTSYRNSLGTIRNWNTRTYSLVGKYSAINF